VFLVVEGDRTAVRYRWRGTHEGAFAGVPTTGKRVETTSAAFLRMDGDRPAEMWAYSDGETPMQ
jgi:predicted ester cyclase